MRFVFSVARELLEELHRVNECYGDFSPVDHQHVVSGLGTMPPN